MNDTHQDTHRGSRYNNNNNGGNRRRRGGYNNRNRNNRGPRRDNNQNQQQQQEVQLAEIDLTVPADKTIIIGITGEPGAGKSALAKEFEKLGAEILDVDELGHAVIETPANKKKLTDAFGKDIIGADKKIDRAVLAAKAFANADETKKLNDIVHPRLTTKVKSTLKKAKNFCILDAALLHELNLGELCTQSIYVRSPRETRIARVAERGWDEAELTRRETAQGDADARRQVCDLTVDNSGDVNLLTTFAKTILARQLGIDLLAAARKSDEPAAEAEPDREPVEAQLVGYLKRQLPDLQEEAEGLGVRDARWLDKHDLVCEILRRVAGGRQDSIVVEGFLEVHKEQHGYIRSPLSHYASCSTDTFISGQQLRRYGLKAGMHITAVARSPRGNERNLQLLNINTVMGEPTESRTRVQNFESLTPLHAEGRLFMERPDQPFDLSLRIIDLVAPIGKGQRGLIVAQPKCGKTVYLQKIANAITTNNPEVELMVLLIDERPEEVTDMQRNIKGEVVASTFDQHSSRHVQIAEMVLNKSKRFVEQGKDEVILIDSITRLARAYNSEAPSSGRIMSGGLESGALIKPKQFFGAARKIENGGSLTILATALVDTGSVMDTVIFEEFKGTGNMELVLDRRLSNKRIFPAVDVAQSGTRKDDLLITNVDELKRVWALRRFLAERSPQDAVEFLKKELKKYKSNVEFLMSLDPDKMSSSFR